MNNAFYVKLSCALCEIFRLVVQIVIKNMKDNTAYRTDVAEFDLVMQVWGSIKFVLVL